MKTIKSKADIEALQNAGISDQVIAHLQRYYNYVLEAYGTDYFPETDGWIILLEERDPITNVSFLEEQLKLLGGRNLVSIIKEFVDFDETANLFDVFVLMNDEFGLTFVLPNEPWIGKELLHHLKTFNNAIINDSQP